MGTKAQLLDWASRQVGHVGGAKYWQEAYGWSGNGLPWCAVFVTDALKQTGTECAFFPSTVAFDLSNHARIGSAFVDKWNLQAGDVLSFDWDRDGVGDHVGIVEKVLGNGTYQTIEGNVSNSCGRRTRYASDIICGIRPRYSGEKSGKLAVDGDFGTLTCKALQEALQRHGYYKDCIIDGDWGHYTKLALQQYLRKLGYYTTAYVLDGWFGPASVTALQTYLRKLGYYGSDYIIDGDWGYWTTCALQKALNDSRF